MLTKVRLEVEVEFYHTGEANLEEFTSRALKLIEVQPRRIIYWDTNQSPTHVEYGITKVQPKETP